jgi:hypothetical protein
VKQFVGQQEDFRIHADDDVLSISKKVIFLAQPFF